MMMLDSGIVRSFASSCSTGNWPHGQSFLNAAASAGSIRLTIRRSNGVSFS